MNETANAIKEMVDSEMAKWTALSKGIENLFGVAAAPEGNMQDVKEALEQRPMPLNGKCRREVGSTESHPTGRREGGQPGGDRVGRLGVSDGNRETERQRNTDTGGDRGGRLGVSDRAVGIILGLEGAFTPETAQAALQKAGNTTKAQPLIYRLRKEGKVNNCGRGRWAVAGQGTAESSLEEQKRALGLKVKTGEED